MEHNQYLNKFIQYLEGERNLSSYTVRNYRTDLNSYFDFLEDNGTYDLAEIGGKEIKNLLRKYVAWLTTERSIQVTNTRLSTATTCGAWPAR